MIALGKNSQPHPERKRISLPTAGQIAQELTGRDYISWSQISSYRSCTLRWWFSHVKQVQAESLSAAMLLGQGIHAALQKWFEARMTAEQTPTLDELMKAYQQVWKAETMPIQYGKEETAESLTETARQMLQAFIDSPHSQPDGEILGIEEPLRVTLDPDLPDLVARVDLLQHQAGELVVTDFKTARSMWNADTAEEHGEQLVLYGEAAEAIAMDLNAKVRLQFLVITKAKTPKLGIHTITASPDRVRRTRMILKQVFRSMQAGVVYPSPSPLACSTCAYQGACQKWHQEYRP